MDGLRERRYKRIVALVGAGISVAAGIPDFRSRGGLYDQMRAQGFKNPMSVFTADFLEKEPRTFYEMFKKLRTDHVKPTLVHWFLRLLYDQGCLLRCYTQNIDALERKVEIPMEYIVEAHGTMSEACCLKCGKASTAKELWACWGSGEGELPRCAFARLRRPSSPRCCILWRAVESAIHRVFSAGHGERRPCVDNGDISKCRAIRFAGPKGWPNLSSFANQSTCALCDAASSMGTSDPVGALQMAPSTEGCEYHRGMRGTYSESHW